MNTIPGGAYKLPDGSFVNAQGKRIPPPDEAELYPGIAEAEPLAAEQIAGAGEEYEKPEDMITDSAEDKPKARRAAKKQS